MTTRRTSWMPLAALLGGMGVLHFVRPEPFERIVPRQLGDPAPWVYGSGAAEIACAAALLSPRTRRAGGLATAALLVGVCPGNLQMALTAMRSSRATTAHRSAALARLPLQAPLVAWALRVARDARR